MLVIEAHPGPRCLSAEANAPRRYIDCDCTYDCRQYKRHTSTTHDEMDKRRTYHIVQSHECSGRAWDGVGECVGRVDTGSVSAGGHISIGGPIAPKEFENASQPTIKHLSQHMASGRVGTRTLYQQNQREQRGPRLKDDRGQRKVRGEGVRLRYSLVRVPEYSLRGRAGPRPRANRSAFVVGVPRRTTRAETSVTVERKDRTSTARAARRMTESISRQGRE